MSRLLVSKNVLLLSALFLSVSVNVFTAQCNTYKWEDGQGLPFTDDLNNVPKKYRGKASTDSNEGNGILSQEASNPHRNGDTKECWLPFTKGISAKCAQGPFGHGTHSEGYAWDFVLKAGTPILAPANGRVVLVVDNHTATGISPKGNSAQAIINYQQTSMANANQIAIDHGDGSYSWFWHHKAGSARIKPGDIVAAGTHIADVGMSGTYIPHICFSVRSPARPESWNVRFRVGGGKTIDIKTGQQSVSQTPVSKGNLHTFKNSILHGSQFEANGVSLSGGQQLYFLPANQEIIYEGRVLEQAVSVGFYLWEQGHSTEFSKTVVPDSSGHFLLKVRIPESSRGQRLYTIAITKTDGSVKYPVSSIAFVN